MSDQRETAADGCPNCGRELLSPNAPHRGWSCGSSNIYGQSQFCRINELTAANAKLQADLAEAKDELENDPGDCADVRLGFENERLAAELAEAKAECERLRDENTHLRAALAVSKDPCVYCQLPKEEMSACKYGFPGCARMDDLTGCPEFGAMLNEQHLREELAAARRDGERLDWLESEAIRECDGWYKALFRRNVLITRKDIDAAMEKAGE